jgi:ATPase subunit of ABC transporter with duplicated ATPase domains
MGLLSNLENIAPKRTCRVDIINQTLEPADSEIFLDAVMNAKFPVKRLEKELRARGVEISDTSIDRHRTKGCSCWKI